MEQRGRLLTDPELFWRLDHQMVYEPEAFAALDLDRHRLSLDDADFERLIGGQKAIAEGATDPAVARHQGARLCVDRALEERGIGTESPDASSQSTSRPAGSLLMPDNLEEERNTISTAKRFRTLSTVAI